MRASYRWRAVLAYGRSTFWDVAGLIEVAPGCKTRTSNWSGQGPCREGGRLRAFRLTSPAEVDHDGFIPNSQGIYERGRQF